MSVDMDVVGVMAAYLLLMMVPCDPKHIGAILNILNIL